MAALLLAACFGFAPAGAQQSSEIPRVTGFFTDMHGDPAGDLDGEEVWIVYGKNGYWATVQLSPGSPDPPVVVPVEVSGVNVSFSIPEYSQKRARFVNDGNAVRFVGTVTKSALSGNLGSNHVVLKRGPSHWQ